MKPKNKMLSRSCLDTLGAIFFNDYSKGATSQISLNEIVDLKNIVQGGATVWNHIQILIEEGVISKSRPGAHEYYEGGRGPNIYKLLKPKAKHDRE